MNEFNLLVPKEVAKILRINLLTVYDLIKRNELSVIKLGREYRIEEQELQKFIQKHVAKGRKK